MLGQVAELRAAMQSVTVICSLSEQELVQPLEAAMLKFTMTLPVTFGIVTSTV